MRHFASVSGLPWRRSGTEDEPFAHTGASEPVALAPCHRPEPLRAHGRGPDPPRPVWRLGACYCLRGGKHRCLLREPAWRACRSKERPWRHPTWCGSHASRTAVCRADAVQRHLSLYLGRPCAGRWHKSIPLCPGRAGAWRPARSRHLAADQSRRLCRNDLSARGPGAVSRHHAHWRERRRHETGATAVRGRHCCRSYSPAQTLVDAANARCGLRLAPAGGLGDRRQRSRRRGHDCLVGGEPPGLSQRAYAACRRNRHAGSPGQADGSSCAPGVLAALELEAPACRLRDDCRCLFALPICWQWRLWVPWNLYRGGGLQRRKRVSIGLAARAAHRSATACRRGLCRLGGACPCIFGACRRLPRGSL